MTGNPENPDRKNLIICNLAYCFDNTADQIISIFEKRFGQPLTIYDKARFAILQEGISK